MQAARQDMVGVSMTAMSLLVVPTFGAEPRLGTNPISIAAPAASEPSLLYDAATSTIAGNKLGLARRVGAMMEPGWIAAPDGTPIMERAPGGAGRPLRARRPTTCCRSAARASRARTRGTGWR